MDGLEGSDSKWLLFYRKYTKEEKRKIIAKEFQVSLETVFRNHIYKYSNNLYTQVTGGGIGATITGIVARILMDW